MSDTRKIEELEKRVDELRQEAYELKQMIQALKTSQTENDRPAKQLPPVGLKTTVQKTQQGPVDWEKKIGQVWLPRIFIFVLLIGVIWAFKAASNYGLINEPVKVISGYLAAAVSIYLGRKQMKQNRLALGHVMLGGSVVLLLIVTFAFHVLYGMILSIPAFCLNLVWIGLGMYFAHLYSSQPLAIVTAVGGYLIPFLLESANPDILYFVTFETVFYLAMLIFAMKKQFQILYYAAFVFLHLTFLAGMMIPAEKDLRFFAIAAVLQHLLLYGTFLINKSFRKQQLGITFTSFVTSAAWVHAAYPKDQYEIVLLAAFVIYTLISIFLWKKDKERLSASFVAAAFSIMLYTISYLEAEQGAGLLIIQGLITIYLGFLALSWFGQGIGGFIFLAGALLTFAHPFQILWSVNFFNWVVLIAVMFALSPYLKKVVKVQDWSSVKTILNVVKMIMILFFLTFFANALTANQDNNIRLMAVSFAWAVDAFVTMVIGAKLDNKLLRLTGLGLLFLTLAKLVFVDLTYLSILIRAILFIVLGLIGMVISRIYYKGPSNGKS